MPASALKSLAKQAGKSIQAAHRYYKQAKKQRQKSTGRSAEELAPSDYEHIMGVVKKRLAASVTREQFENALTFLQESHLLYYQYTEDDEDDE